MDVPGQWRQHVNRGKRAATRKATGVVGDDEPDPGDGPGGRIGVVEGLAPGGAAARQSTHLRRPTVSGGLSKAHHWPPSREPPAIAAVWATKRVREGPLGRHQAASNNESRHLRINGCATPAFGKSGR